MQGTQKLTIKIDTWRFKAKHRRQQNCRLTRRVRELTHSRDGWKGKYQSQQQELLLLRKENKALRCVVRSDRALLDIPRAKPASHHYGNLAILFCLWMRQQGHCSLRTCAQMMSGLSTIFHLRLGCPSHTTISNWEKKLGCYRLGQAPYQDTEWVVLIDESGSIGKQKMLLILGIPVKDYQVGKAPDFTDTHVLYLSIKPSWNSVQISEALGYLQQRGLQIAYCVNDRGSNICKAVRDMGLIHILDCTHAFSHLLEKKYRGQEVFNQFSKACSLFKRRVMLSDAAIYVPPTQRSKGRFLNLGPLAQWAYQSCKLLKQYQSDPEQGQQYELLKWLEPYESLIEQMYHCCQTIKALFRILKNQGLSLATQQSCENLLRSSLATPDFCQNIRQYMEQMLARVADRESILCNSDVIESYFGKFKSRLSSHPHVGITDNCLVMANFNMNFDQDQIQQAMQKIRMVDLAEWKKNNVPINKLQQRRKMFKNGG